MNILLLKTEIFHSRNNPVETICDIKPTQNNLQISKSIDAKAYANM